jgi:hypothetical protein
MGFLGAEGAQERVFSLQVKQGMAGLLGKHGRQVIQFGDAGLQVFHQGLGIVMELDQAAMGS